MPSHLLTVLACIAVSACMLNSRVVAQPTEAATASSSASASASGTLSPSSSPSSLASFATLTASGSPSAIVSGSPSATMSGSPSATVSGSPSATMSGSPSAVSPYPTATMSGSPSATVSASPSATMSGSPSATATLIDIQQLATISTSATATASPSSTTTIIVESGGTNTTNSSVSSPSPSPSPSSLVNNQNNTQSGENNTETTSTSTATSSITPAPTPSITPSASPLPPPAVSIAFGFDGISLGTLCNDNSRAVFEIVLMRSLMQVAGLSATDNSTTPSSSTNNGIFILQVQVTSVLIASTKEKVFDLRSGGCGLTNLNSSSYIRGSRRLSGSSGNSNTNTSALSALRLPLVILTEAVTTSAQGASMLAVRTQLHSTTMLQSVSSLLASSDAATFGNITISVSNVTTSGSDAGSLTGGGGSGSSGGGSGTASSSGEFSSTILAIAIVITGILAALFTVLLIKATSTALCTRNNGVTPAAGSLGGVIMDFFKGFGIGGITNTTTPRSGGNVISGSGNNNTIGNKTVPSFVMQNPISSTGGVMVHGNPIQGKARSQFKVNTLLKEHPHHLAHHPQHDHAPISSHGSHAHGPPGSHFHGNVHVDMYHHTTQSSSNQQEYDDTDSKRDKKSKNKNKKEEYDEEEIQKKKKKKKHQDSDSDSDSDDEPRAGFKPNRR